MGLGGNMPVTEIHCPDNLAELMNFETSSALALSQYIKLECQDNLISASGLHMYINKYIQPPHNTTQKRLWYLVK